MFFPAMTIPAHMLRALSEDVNQPELRDRRCFAMTSTGRSRTKSKTSLRKEPVRVCACR